MIKKGCLDEREAVSYFRQIIHGVEYCHRFNICHRDLKPENLLLDKHRNIKIADFGMAALETSDRMLETSCGSPHYASPEIVAGKIYHGAPSDIWSCGIILFALLTGHLPFDDDNIRKLLLKVQEGKFDMPESISPSAKDLIWKMLRVDPSARLSMEEILEHPLLRKYPAKRTSHRLFSPVSTDFIARPVKCAEEVDPDILKNLQTLWHGASRDSVVEKLVSEEPNSEKTFYCLLMKYRHDHIDENETSPRRKSSTPSFKSGHRTPSIKSPAYVTRHSRVASRSSSRHRSRSRVRSRSRSQSRSRAARNRSGSFSKNRQHSVSFIRRTHSVASSSVRSQTASPPPPLPMEAVRMVEAELSERGATTDDSRNCSEFASMLEQAFNFDTSVSYGRGSTIPPKTPRSGSIYRTPSQFEDPPSPFIDTSSPGILYTSSPMVPHPQPDFVLPRIFEEDRFADAVEEEMDLHMKRSLERNIFDAEYARPKQSRRATMETPTQNRTRLERQSLPGFATARSRPISMFGTCETSTFSFSEIPGREDLSTVGDFGFNSNETSRLRISDLLKTDSFQTNISSERSLAVSGGGGDIQASPPFAYNAKFTMRASLQLPRDRPKEPPVTQTTTTTPIVRPVKTPKSPNKRHSAPNLEKVRVRVEPRLSDPPKVTEKLSSVSEISSSKQQQQLVDITGNNNNKGKGGINLFRRLSLVPKRAAPAIPETVSEMRGGPKPRAVSAASNADTIGSSTTSYQSRQRYSNAPSITGCESSADGGEQEQEQVQVSKQNWFMKMLNGRSETKGYYSPLSAAVLRRLIILILSEWQQYGISNISEDTVDDASSTIRAKISSRNVLSLRSARFRIEIEAQALRSSYYSQLRKSGGAGGRGSDTQMVTSVIIVRERGSSNTFLRFLGEMERTLEERNALIKPQQQQQQQHEDGFEREHHQHHQNVQGIYV